MQVLSSSGTSSKIQNGAGSKDYFKTVELIQTVIKGAANLPLGEYLWINFYAPIDEDNPQADIEYDYKNMPSDFELISSGDDQAYI